MSVNIDELMSTRDLMEKVANLTEMCDVTLVSGIDEQKFPAHRLILIASSKYFKVFLGPKFPEGAANEIVVKDIDASTLKSILDFIYFGRIEITAENVGNLIAAASSMELLVLGKRCGDFWKTNLSIENCVEVLLSADKYRLQGLSSSALEFICEHFEAVSIDDMMRIDEKNFQELLNRDQITAAETVVFDRMVQWMNKNVPEGGKVDLNLLKSIRLGNIPTALLVEKVEPLWKKYDCSDAVMDEYRDRLLSSQPVSLHRYESTDAHCSPFDPSQNDTDYLKFQLAENDSKEFSIELTVGNCVEIYLRADKYGFNNLRSKALKFICGHFEAMPLDDVLRIGTKNFQDVLGYDQITAAETVVFDRLVRWMTNNTRASEIASDMLKLIRLNHMPTAFLIETVEPYFKQFNYEDIVTSEYRRRLLKPEMICLHRYTPMDIYGSFGHTSSEGINICKYDFAKNDWNEIKSISFGTKREGFGSIFVNGELFIMGGISAYNIHGYTYFASVSAQPLEHVAKLYNFFFNGVQVESYNLKNWNKTILLSMRQNRYNFTPMCVGKYIYAFGGYSHGSQVSTCERFDTANGLWQTRKSMPTTVYNYSAVEYNGNIYVADTSNFYCYDPDADLWSSKAKLTSETPALAKSKDLLYAIDRYWTVHQYDPNQDVWTTIGNFGYFGSIAKTINHFNQIYIFCRDEKFKVLKIGDSCTFIRLNGVPSVLGANLFSYRI